MEVYFDNSATTKPFDEVVEVVGDIMKNYYGNPSSAHSLGLKAEDKLKSSKRTFAKILNCSGGEIIFTSGGSESNNFLIRGFVKPGNHVITTRIEHPSILNVCEMLEKSGVEVTYLDVDCKGRIDLAELSNSIKKNTVVVSIMHANNEIGSVQDIEAIGKLIKEKSGRAKFHVDAVQSFGKLHIDVNRCKIDLLSASAHKVHGPRGIGLAYVRKGLCPEPLIYGGGQERALRSGTENLPAICGFALAAEKMNSSMEQNYERIFELKKYFIESLKSIENIKINSPLEQSFLPHVVSISFPGFRGEVLLHALEEKGIYVSTGSACSSKKHSQSSVLKAIGLNESDSEGTIRFSFNEWNVKEEVDYTLENLKSALMLLRRLKK